MSSMRVNDSYNNNNKFNTNRLLYEAEALNSKVNQYRKTLSLGFPLQNIPQTEPVSTSMCRTGAIFNPKCNINTLNSVSNTFVSMAQMPELSDKGEKEPSIAISNLKKSYEAHISNLYSNFKVCIAKLEELYSTFSSTNKTDIPLIKQILNDNLFHERESQIANFIEEITELKATNVSPSQSNEIIQTQIESVKQNYEREMQKKINESQSIIHKMKKESKEQNNNLNEYQEQLALLKEENDETKNEMDRLQKVISVLEIDLNSTDTQLKEKASKYEALQHDFANLQAQFFDASLKLKKYAEDNSTMKNMIEHYEKERKEMLEKYSSYNTDREMTQNDLMVSIEKQHQSKFENYINTINNLREQSSRLENELKNEREKLGLNKKNYTKLYEEMQEKVKLLSSEWDKKLQANQSNYEKIIIEIEQKNKTNVDTIIQDHQNEIESMNREMNKLKQSTGLLKSFEKEYIRISDHEQRVNDELVKLQSKYDDEYNMKHQLLEKEYKIKLSQDDNDKKIEYEFLTENIKSNLRKAEKQEIELKNELMVLENRLEKEKERNDKSQNEISALNINILEKQKEINVLKEECSSSKEMIIKKDNEIEKQKKEIECLNSRNSKLDEIETIKANERNVNLNLKKEIQTLILSNKEYEAKIKTQTEAVSNLTNEINVINRTKQKLFNSLIEIKNDLKGLKQYYSQLIQNTKSEMGKMIETLNSKLINYDMIKKSQIKDIEKKFERHFTEQFRSNERLQKENKALTELRQESSLKTNDLVFKVSEIENELKNSKSLVFKYKDDIIIKEAEIDKLTQIIQDSNKKMRNVISELVLKTNKIKKKCQSEIFALRSYVNAIMQSHTLEVNELASMNHNFGLKNIIKELKNESIIHTNSIQKLKTMNKALSIDVDNGKEEMINTKNEYDRLIGLKDKKIKDLQSIINQSINSYNSGVNSIKVSQKLNDDVKNFIKKAKAYDTSAINSKNE